MKNNMLRTTALFIYLCLSLSLFAQEQEEQDGTVSIDGSTPPAVSQGIARSIAGFGITDLHPNSDVYSYPSVLFNLDQNIFHGSVDVAFNSSNSVIETVNVSPEESLDLNGANLGLELGYKQFRRKNERVTNGLGINFRLHYSNNEGLSDEFYVADEVSRQTEEDLSLGIDLEISGSRPLLGLEFGSVLSIGADYDPAKEEFIILQTEGTDTLYGPILTIDGDPKETAFGNPYATGSFSLNGSANLSVGNTYDGNAWSFALFGDVEMLDGFNLVAIDPEGGMNYTELVTFEEYAQRPPAEGGLGEDSGNLYEQALAGELGIRGFHQWGLKNGRSLQISLEYLFYRGGWYGYLEKYSDANYTVIDENTYSLFTDGRILTSYTIPFAENQGKLTIGTGLDINFEERYPDATGLALEELFSDSNPDHYYELPTPSPGPGGILNQPDPHYPDRNLPPHKTLTFAIPLSADLSLKAAGGITLFAQAQLGFQYIRRDYIGIYVASGEQWEENEHLLSLSFTTPLVTGIEIDLQKGRFLMISAVSDIRLGLASTTQGDLSDGENTSDSPGTASVGNFSAIEINLVFSVRK